MFIVRDPTTHIEFMVDSGSCRSVILCHRPARHPSVTGFMSCLNDSEVFTFESVELELTLNLGRSFTWTFVKADVLRYIGAGFSEPFWSLSRRPPRQVSLTERDPC